MGENANSIQDAMEALPNFAIPEVEVDFDGTTDVKKPAITVTFTDGHNTGMQTKIIVMNKATCAAGSQPLFESVNALGDISCIGLVSRWLTITITEKRTRVPTAEFAIKALVDATASTATLALLVTTLTHTSKLF